MNYFIINGFVRRRTQDFIARRGIKTTLGPGMKTEKYSFFSPTSTPLVQSVPGFYPLEGNSWSPNIKRAQLTGYLTFYAKSRCYVICFPSLEFIEWFCVESVTWVFERKISVILETARGKIDHHRFQFRAQMQVKFRRGCCC